MKKKKKKKKKKNQAKEKKAIRRLGRRSKAAALAIAVLSLSLSLRAASALLSPPRLRILSLCQLDEDARFLTLPKTLAASPYAALDSEGAATTAATPAIMPRAARRSTTEAAFGAGTTTALAEAPPSLEARTATVRGRAMEAEIMIVVGWGRATGGGLGERIGDRERVKKEEKRSPGREREREREEREERVSCKAFLRFDFQASPRPPHPRERARFRSQFRRGGAAVDVSAPLGRQGEKREAQARREARVKGERKNEP